MRTRFVALLTAVLVSALLSIPLVHAEETSTSWTFDNTADFTFNASEVRFVNSTAAMLMLDGDVYPDTASIITTTGVAYTDLDRFSAETLGTVKFQLSTDKASWYSLTSDGSDWRAVSGVGEDETMTAVDLNIAIGSFATEMGADTLFIKAVLYAPETEDDLAPSIDSMTLHYTTDVVVTAVPVQESSCFTDTPSTHPDALAVCALKERGVVAGVDADHFFPNTTARRGEAFKIATGGRDVSAYATRENPFVDLPNSHTLKNWILYLYHNGVISGYDATHMGPDNSLTEAEATKVILNLNGILTTTPAAGQTYGLPEGSSLIPYVHTALTKNLLRGGATEFSPQRAMTRGKIATLMYRVVIMNENQQTSYQE